MIVRISTYGQYGKEDYLGRPGYDALAQAYGGMMNITGDPSGPPQRAKTFTGDYVTALTGWASTMMALWEVKKTGRGQVVDLAQYEAVAQTQGNTSCPSTPAKGQPTGTPATGPPDFSPTTPSSARTAGCSSARSGGAIFTRVPKFLGLDPTVYNYDACSKDAAAVNSDKGRELDQPLARILRRADGAGGRDKR